ncbi:1,4-dihydroxy-2-naphthoate polyprenyltransferase [Corynebacterium sp. zg-331]|uniref:1,4-dihydroxy-2-naphthoate polyprenyltransferase n=1 Tax=unclassified Corynebacterium TaxID=2624378 RepID=UPI00128D4057|nr:MULTISPECIES: 1,4-dihydroxy-2-naphthoate polyprenyltransferase [unclassified Corynebacterium]MBC3186089.1 1,4-dihydroxy-2-naphthoate polyprenyltransferase [Corynebacterium sp. zg-331]MPV52579.1 1,4-dihydroxy-2-naphthoate polyprenyltransferase [Corynebacterium sp. zg331]
MISSPQPRRATPADWWAGARPHTWANALAPVIAGTGAAALDGAASWWRALLALGVAWALIIGVNYANDYSDGIRGTDEDRSGPLRLTGSGLAAPQAVRRAAFLAFFIAGAFGVALSLASSWWLILVGAGCIAGAWFYTGGSRPYGYRGWGEAAVFVFFGLVAVLGTQYTQAGAVTWAGLACAVGVGSISAAVNLANNLRDIPSDAASGKITLAVRLGEAATRRLFCGLITVPFALCLPLAVGATPWALLGLLAVPLGVIGARPVLRGATGAALIPVLGLTGRAMLAWSAAMFLGFVLA